MTTAQRSAPTAERDSAKSPDLAPPTARHRIESVDVLRGAIMILMALDHTRDFFGDAAASPTNLATTTIPLFFTRWITHFCAPVFFLLAGTGARLAASRRTTAEISRFLLTRGLWLVVLELTVMRALWQFNVDYHVLILNVLWALGWSMVALAALVWLPIAWITAIGAAMVLLHNAADGIGAQSLGTLAPLWNVLHQPGLIVATPRILILLAYPLVPWIGVMALGYALGEVMTWAPERRRVAIARLGAALVVGFVALRAANVYGDPARWAPQRSGAFTALSFINATKYPPSLLFLLMTLGPALLVLAWLERRFATRGSSRLLEIVRTYGRVPFFYYMLHVLLLHTIAVVDYAVRFGTIAPAFQSPTPDRFPITQLPGWPSSLPWVYLTWATVVVLAYPFCRWYANVKARRRDWWLSYL